MTFKSPTQPLCRNCGRRIRKRTALVRVKEKPSEYDRPDLGFSSYHYGVLHTKADCQRVSNQKVVSVDYHEIWEDDPSSAYGDRTSRRGTVNTFTTWDGESYEDPYFCTGTCAKEFGYRAARSLYK